MIGGVQWLWKNWQNNSLLSQIIGKYFIQPGVLCIWIQFMGTIQLLKKISTALLVLSFINMLGLNPRQRTEFTNRLYSFKAIIHIYWCGKQPHQYHIESQDINTSCYGVFLHTYICWSTLSAFIMCLSTESISHHNSQPLPFRIDAGYRNIMRPENVYKYLLVEVLYRQVLRLLLVFLCIWFFVLLWFLTGSDLTVVYLH